MFCERFCEFCGSGSACAVCGRGRNRFMHDLGDMTARFWVWHVGAWVKLSLRPGESLCHTFSAQTDEGWRAESNTWVNESGCVRWTWHTYETDCDGPTERGGELVCKVEDLAKVPAWDDETIRRPEWDVEEKYSRDFAAEAAGY